MPRAKVQKLHRCGSHRHRIMKIRAAGRNTCMLFELNGIICANISYRVFIFPTLVYYLYIRRPDDRQAGGLESR